MLVFLDDESSKPQAGQWGPPCMKPSPPLVLPSVVSRAVDPMLSYHIFAIMVSIFLPMPLLRRGCVLSYIPNTGANPKGPWQIPDGIVRY